MTKQTKAPAKGATPAKAKASASAKPTAKATGTANLVKGIFVRSLSPTGTFRRCGITFTRQGVGVALDAVTEAQLAAIKAEPMLIWEETEFPATPEDDARLGAEADETGSEDTPPPAATGNEPPPANPADNPEGNA